MQSAAGNCSERAGLHAATGAAAGERDSDRPAEKLCQSHRHDGWTRRSARRRERTNQRTGVALQRHLFRDGDYPHHWFQRLHHTVYSAPGRLRRRQRIMNKAHGVAVAIVKDLNDPLGEGRIGLQYPWLPDNTTSGWAPMTTPLAGNNRGMFFMPEQDDEVL